MLQTQTRMLPGSNMLGNHPLKINKWLVWNQRETENNFLDEVTFAWALGLSQSASQEGSFGQPHTSDPYLWCNSKIACCFHRIADWLRSAGTSGSIWSKSSVPAGPPRACAQDQVQTASEDLQGWELNNFWAACASAPSPGQHRRAAWWLDRTSWVPVCAHCPPMSRALLHLVGPLLQAFTDITKTPLSLLFFRLDSLSSLSLCSQDRCSRPFTILVALHQTLVSIPMSLLYWGPRTGHTVC